MTDKTPEIATQFSAEQVALLRAPLEKSRVSQREGAGKKKLDYLEGWDVIAHANHVFGFDGWDRETVEMVEMWTGERRNSYGETKACVAFRCKVRVTVYAGTRRIVREGTGFGDGQGRDLGEAFELATKEAETDAMKRAFMTFGNGFGLALYDKSRESVVDDTKEAPKDPPRQPERAKPAPQQPASEPEPQRAAARRQPSEQERLEAGTPMDRRQISQRPEDRSEPEPQPSEAPRQQAPRKPDKGEALAESARAAKAAKAAKASGASIIQEPRMWSEETADDWTTALDAEIRAAANRDAAIAICQANASAIAKAAEVLGSNVRAWAMSRINHHHGAAKEPAR